MLRCPRKAGRWFRWFVAVVGTLAVITQDGLVGRSTDRGQTWTMVRKPDEDGTILKSSDGGLTWPSVAPGANLLPVNPATGRTVSLRDVAALDADTVFVVGKKGTVLRSEDGGAHWQAIAFPLVPVRNTGTGQAIEPHLITFANAQTGYLVVHPAKVFRTDDGGVTWHTEGQDWFARTGPQPVALAPQAGGAILIAAYPDGLLVSSEEITPPPAPANLQAVVGSRQVRLSWDPASAFAVSAHRVQRATAPDGPYATVAANAAGGTYLDQNLENDLTYYYRVYAVNPAGSGTPATVSATPSLALAGVPGRIEQFELLSANGSVELRWGAPAETGAAAITAYTVYRATAPAGPYGPLAEVPPAGGAWAGDAVYTDATARAGTVYWYRVTAGNEAGEGPPSPALSVDPDVVWVETDTGEIIPDKELHFAVIRPSPASTRRISPSLTIWSGIPSCP